jgi:hypothetical protein
VNAKWVDDALAGILLLVLGTAMALVVLRCT